MDKKRLAIAAIFLLVCILIGYGLYRAFFAPRNIPTGDTTASQGGSTNQNFPNIGQGENNGQPAPTNPTLPESGTRAGQTTPTTGSGTAGANRAPTNERISQAVDSQVRGVGVSAQGGVQFYNNQDGKFYKIGPDGKPVPLSDQVFYNVDKVTWSPKGAESIIQYPDGAKIYYNFDTKKQATLPKHWNDFSFSPNGEKVAAKSIGIDPENRWLITSNPDGSSIKLIEPMGENADKVTVDWSPNKQVVALSRTGEALGADRQQVLLVGLNKENFRGLTVEGRGLQTKWSPGGSKLLHSVYSANSDFKPQLWIANGDPDNVGANRKLLDVATWADKCVMADDRFVYCGVPTRLDTGAGFTPTIADQTPDKLYKIDTATGLKTELPLDKTYTINNIVVGDNGQSLYFTDKNQPGMFKVKL